MDKTDTGVAIYETHAEAEAAVKLLEKSGFDMRKISILGKDYHTEETVVGYFNIGERALFFGKLGAFWGGLAGILFGSALLFVPVVGHIFVLGPLTALLVSGLEGSVVGAGVSALFGALTGIGIPKDSVLQYETALKASKFLVLVHGDEQEVNRAHDILKGANLSSFDHHHN